MNRKNKQLNISRELHSNLKLFTTSLTMISFVVIMLIYMGLKNPALNNTAINTSRIGGAASWIAAAFLAFHSVRGRKKYFVEYVIYLMIMGFGFTFMFNVPAIIFFNFNVGNLWARNTLIVLCAVTAIFFFISVIWHAILAAGKGK